MNDHVRQCKSCDDFIDLDRRVPICKTCRLLFGWGMFVGGAIVDALVAIF